MSALIRLDPASIEAVAQRTAELLRGAAAPELVTAAKIATRLGVDRSFIYEHADELGAVKLGDGPRARLRFDPENRRQASSRPFTCEARTASSQAAPSTWPSAQRRRVAPYSRGVVAMSAPSCHRSSIRPPSRRVEAWSPCGPRGRRAGLPMGALRLARRNFPRPERNS